MNVCTNTGTTTSVPEQVDPRRMHLPSSACKVECSLFLSSADKRPTKCLAVDVKLISARSDEHILRNADSGTLVLLPFLEPITIGSAKRSMLTSCHCHKVFPSSRMPWIRVCALHSAVQHCIVQLYRTVALWQGAKTSARHTKLQYSIVTALYSTVLYNTELFNLDYRSTRQIETRNGFSMQTFAMNQLY